MSSWYKDKLRRTLLDMHIENWNDGFMAEFSPEAYYESLKIGNINAPMIYIQSHVGLCYWPTKSGEMHKGFIGKEDSMKRLFDLCHQGGMDVIAYYSLVYNNWAYEKYPAWRMKTVEGLGARDTGKRYGFCCPNNLEYREFTKTQMAEFFEYFTFEGIFLDMVFWPFICYCDSCKARWVEEVGGEMPTVVDWKDVRWQTFQQKREQWLGEFANAMTAEVKKLNPACTVEHQYHTAIKMWRFGVTQNIALASDYAGGDLYGGMAQQTFACKQYYNLSENQPFEYMTSRCYPILSEHTTNKSDEQLELSVMLTYLHHGASLIIDAIDPVGTHDPRVYEQIGKVYKKAEKLEPYVKRGTHVYDVGLYFNMEGKMDVEQEPGGVDTAAASLATPYPQFEAAFGAANAMRKHKIPFSILNNWKLELLNNARVLVIADAPNMSQRELATIKTFIREGGKVYLSGHSAQPLVEEMFGIKIKGYTDEKITYMAPTPAGDDLMLGYFTQKYPMAVFDRAAKAEGQAEGTVLATVTLPYTQPNPVTIWVDIDSKIGAPRFGKEDKRYPFASIHSNPPGVQTQMPALIRKQYGKGEVIWSAIAFEKSDRMQHSDIFANIIKDLADNKLMFASDAPECVELILFEDKEKGQKLLGVANVQESFRFIPIGKFTISVQLKSKPRRIAHLPDEQEITFEYKDGYATFSVDGLHVAEMFLIQEEI